MWQFTGGNSSTNGIPARDLTDAEWNAIPQWLRDIALSHGYYKNVDVTVPDVVNTSPVVEIATPASADPKPDLKPALKPRKK